LTYLIFIGFGLLFALSKWVSFDILNRRQKLYESEEIKFSKFFLNVWDWWVKGKLNVESTLSDLGKELHISLKEETLKEIIKKW